MLKDKIKEFISKHCVPIGLNYGTEELAQDIADICEKDYWTAKVREVDLLEKENTELKEELFAVKALNKCLANTLAKFRKKYGCEYQLSEKVNIVCPTVQSRTDEDINQIKEHNF